MLDLIYNVRRTPGTKLGRHNTVWAKNATVGTATAGDERELLRIFPEVEMGVAGKGDTVQVCDQFSFGARTYSSIVSVQQARYSFGRHLSLAERDEGPFCFSNDAKVSGGAFLENSLFHCRYVSAAHDNRGPRMVSLDVVNQFIGSLIFQADQAHPDQVWLKST
jgi:hypothetical protein